MKFYYNFQGIAANDPFCCERLKKDFYDTSLVFSGEENGIKIFDMLYGDPNSEKLLNECPYCHEKLETEICKKWMTSKNTVTLGV